MIRMKYKGPIVSFISGSKTNEIRSLFLFEARMSAKETVYGGSAALPKVEEACQSIKVKPLVEPEIKNLTKYEDEDYAKITRWTNSRK